MEAYLDEEEVVFSSPIARRHADTTKPKDKDTQPPLKSPAKPAKLWALGKQTLDDERVFRFEEEESPAKQRGAHRGTKGKNANSRVYSRWDYSSSDSENSQTTSDDEDNKENVSSNIKELIEIEEKLSKIKLEKEQESSTRLVCSFVVLFCVARVRPFFLSSLLISSLVHLVQYSSSSFLFYFTFSRFSVTSLIINTIPQHHNTTTPHPHSTRIHVFTTVSTIHTPQIFINLLTNPHFPAITPNSFFMFLSLPECFIILTLAQVVVVDTNCLINAKQRDAILALKHYTQLLFIIPFVGLYCS